MMVNNHLNAKHLLVYFMCIVSFITDQEKRYYVCSHLMVQEIKWFNELSIFMKLVELGSLDQIRVCLTLKLLTIISDYLVQWFSKFSVCQNHQDGLLKHRFLGPT